MLVIILQLMALTAPHGNEDSLKHELRSDCSMCAPTGAWILISLAVLKKLAFSWVDVKVAVLHAGVKERIFHVFLRRKS